MATPNQCRVFTFGLFEVDLEAGELRKSGMRQKVAGQPFEILRVLLERPREIVTREELRQRIWPQDTFVDYDLALRKAITRLREVLGDSADSPRFIETVPRRGYRFIAPLSANGDAGAVAGLPTEARQSQHNIQIGIALGVGAAALLVALLGLMRERFRWRQSDARAAAEIRSLAVLPLQNLSADPAQEYFSDGLTDALIADLAQIGSLKVISRTSTMLYKKSGKPLPEIARELRVDGIVEGSVQRSGNRVLITAQLIQGSSDKHLWANSYERDMRDVFALERDVTADIARQVQARLTTQNQTLTAQPRSVNLHALEAYLQGKYHLNRYGRRAGEEEMRKAAEYFQRAIDADPNFAPAYLGLAEAHNSLWWPSSEDFALMKKAADKAVELDAASSDARTELAMTKFEDWDWAGAEEEYRRAIMLNPNSASAHDGLGGLLDSMGRLEEGWKEQELAQELDPNRDHLSWALYDRGDYDRSIELARKLLETGPEDVGMHFLLSQDYAQKGMYKEWVKELSETLTLMDFPESAGRVQRAFAMSGYTGALRQFATELERFAARKQGYFPGTLAEAYALLGDKDRTFYWLGEGVDHHRMAVSDAVLTGFQTNPIFAPFRSDPRFEDLRRRMGLPP